MFGKHLVPCAEGEDKQAGHVASRTLGHKQLQKEETEVEGKNEASYKIPPTVEREATDDRDEFWSTSGDYVPIPLKHVNSPVA